MLERGREGKQVDKFHMAYSKVKSSHFLSSKSVNFQNEGWSLNPNSLIPPKQLWMGGKHRAASCQEV